MAFCTDCGSELKDGAKFCPKCGKPVTVQHPQSEPSEASSNYSIELVSVASGRHDEVYLALMDLLKIELRDAMIKVFSAPCSLATGLSLSKAELFSKKMENAGAVIVMKNNGELVSEIGNQQLDELDNGDDLGCVALAFSFLIPIVGFLIFAFNWRQKPRIAETALLSGAMGIIFSAIISIIHLISYWDGYFRLIQIITGKY